MSKNQQVPEFDENFFANIAVPLTKDYSRLSSSPSRDQPCDSSYFDKHFQNLECDTPVKMRLPTASRDSGDALPTLCMENFLSSSSGSDHTVNGDQRDSKDAIVQESISTTATTTAKQQLREPLKIVPNESGPTPIQTSDYDKMVDDIQKLTMFAPKEPEERLSQRRRSAQRKQQEEESKRRSQISASSKTVSSANRARSISSKRSVSREPSAAARAPSVPRSRHNSVTRTISAPVAAATGGVVTRSMAARAAEVATTAASAAKPIVRRSVMPMKIAQKTPVAALKDVATTGGDRSRDRTRRTNTTGTSSASRRSVFPGKSSATSTPIAPPRRSASANKGSAIKTTPSARPMATANRSSMLRMNAVKPTVPQAAPATTGTAAVPVPVQKPLAAANANPIRNRVPLRVTPLTPSAASKKSAVPSLGQRQPPVLRSQSVERGSAQKQPPASLGTPRQPATKASRADLFNRLSMPKSSATPQRQSHEGPTSSLRKSAVRPVPSYVHSVTKNGLPSSGGLHGIRAPSKERAAVATASALASNAIKNDLQQQQ